jgi:hypothetical protein
MRLRLGLLQDPAAIDRQIAREVAEAEARRKRAAIPTVKTEEQTKREELLLKKEVKDIEGKVKEKTQPRIRPLSESKAIETGANFISETFLFCVAGGIIVFEWWRQGRKESNRRDEVSDRLSSLEMKMDRIEMRLFGEAGEDGDVIVLASALPAKVKEAIHEQELRLKEKEEEERKELESQKNSNSTTAPTTKPTKS